MYVEAVVHNHNLHHQWIRRQSLLSHHLSHRLKSVIAITIILLQASPLQHAKVTAVTTKTVASANGLLISYWIFWPELGYIFFIVTILWPWTYSSYTGGWTLGSTSLYQLSNGPREAEFSILAEKDAISLRDHDAIRDMLVLDTCLACILKKAQWMPHCKA
jgi:hypothetical protein